MGDLGFTDWRGGVWLLAWLLAWPLAGLLALLWSGTLIVYDLRFRRLPDWLTLPAAVLSLGWFNAAGLIWPGVYLGFGLLKGGIGGGDIKLAIPLGMVLGHVLGPLGVLVAMMLANVVTVLTGFLARRAGVVRPPAHGPAMLGAAGAVLVWAAW